MLPSHLSPSQIEECEGWFRDGRKFFGSKKTRKILYSFRNKLGGGEGDVVFPPGTLSRTSHSPITDLSHPHVAIFFLLFIYFFFS